MLVKEVKYLQMSEVPFTTQEVGGRVGQGSKVGHHGISSWGAVGDSVITVVTTTGGYSGHDWTVGSFSGPSVRTDTSNSSFNNYGGYSNYYFYYWGYYHLDTSYCTRYC